MAHGPKLAVVGDRVANAGLGGPHVLCAVVGKQGELGTERADKPTAKLVVVDARVALDGKNRCGGTRGRPARACLTSPATALYPRTAMPASRTSMVGHWSKDTPRVASSPPIGMRFLLTHRGIFAGLPQTATIASLPGAGPPSPIARFGGLPHHPPQSRLGIASFCYNNGNGTRPRVRTGGHHDASHGRRAALRPRDAWPPRQECERNVGTGRAYTLRARPLRCLPREPHHRAPRHRHARARGCWNSVVPWERSRARCTRMTGTSRSRRA